MSWLTMRIDDGFTSFGCHRSMTSARSPSAVNASTWLNGSSMKRISGSTDSARAMPRRCFIPRELSGGVKQRLGMARALSVDPEILFMDEPFSHVDALTAEGLRAEVIDLWQPKDVNPSSILMVSHDIKEVVYIADRIIVLSSHPGRVRTVVQNPLPRPRDYRARESEELVDYLHEIITGAEMPDVPAAAAPARARIEPLPQATTSEIVGLLEYLDAHGGVDDIFDLAAETDHEFGHMM